MENASMDYISVKATGIAPLPDGGGKGSVRAPQYSKRKNTEQEGQAEKKSERKKR